MEHYGDADIFADIYTDTNYESTIEKYDRENQSSYCCFNGLKIG